MTETKTPRCCYVWLHKGKYYVCGYKAIADLRCHLHLCWPGELGVRLKDVENPMAALPS